MILELYIKNFILIEESKLRFGEGLNIITGETGAGKSILLNAISLCLGERWDKSYARDKTKSTIVETTFYIKEEWLRKNLTECGFSCMDDGIIIISRELLSDGKSITSINGRNVKLSTLKMVSAMVIDIHSQHESYAIFEKEKYLYYLDQYGKSDIEDSKKAYEQIYSRYKHIDTQIESHSIDRDEKQKQREIDLLEFQIEEIEQEDLESQSVCEIEKELERLRNVKKIEDIVNGCHSKLYSSDFNICDSLYQINKEFTDISSFDTKLEGFKDCLEEAYHSLNELARDIRNYGDTMSFDYLKLEQLEDKMSAINNLKRKYGNTVEEILNYKNEMKKRLDDIRNTDELIQQLIREREGIKPHLEKAAIELSKIRKEVADKFKAKMEREVRTLNNNYAEFEIGFGRKAKYEKSGIDDIMFLVSFNLGEKLLPINKVASGGEISRFMLALKNVITQYESVQTLIFDEIDTGISGITAQVVGEKLKEISKKKQIICITHLPQIAVNAAHHFNIIKTASEGRAITSIEKLTEGGKVKEIARLMGGLNITQTTIKSAKEILDKVKSD